MWKRYIRGITEFFQKKPWFFFALTLMGLFFYLRFHQYLELHPMSDHMWAQCDRASVARNYSEESMNIFLPRVHYTGEGKGITGMEFPFVNYTVAIQYKLFGFNETWYRLTMALIMFGGLQAAMLLFNLYLKNIVASATIVLTWYLSPILTYYSPNFIPDTASLGFILAFWYFFFRGVNKPDKLNLSCLFLSGALSGLIKITSLISVISAIAIIVLNFVLKDESTFFPKKGSKRLLFITVLIIPVVASWYFYAGYLSKIYAGWTFMMKPNPAQSVHEYFFNLKFIWYRFHEQYYHPVFYAIIAFSALTLVLFFRKINKLLLLATALTYAGSFIFFSVMIRQFYHHDYYIITLLTGPLFQLLCTAELLLRLLQNRNLVYGSGIIMLVILMMTATYTRRQVSERFSPAGSIHTGSDKYFAYYGIEPYLREIGLKRSDRVLSYFDDSPNITLYLLNQKGWSIPFGKDSGSLAALMQFKADYIIVNDQYLKDARLPEYILQQKIGQFKSISIYRKTNTIK